MTPRMSSHARLRCREMGVSTKRAKRVVQRRLRTYTGTHGNRGLVVVSDDPEIAVVWDPDSNYVLTVLPRTQQDYVRATVEVPV